MALKTIAGQAEAQDLNDNFSYLNSEKIGKSELAVNVNNFGAVGDGIVDDTLAIQAAVDYCYNTKKHSYLLFPAGIYRITDTIILKGALYLKGEGKHGKLSDTEYNGTMIIFDGANDTAMFDIQVSYKFRIEDMRLGRASASITGVIGLYSTSLLSELSIKNVNFNGGFKYAIDVENVSISKLSHCDFSACENGVRIGRTYSLWVSNINFWKISGNAFTITDRVISLSVRDTWQEYCQNGFVFDGAIAENVIFDGVHFTSASLSGQNNERFVLIKNNPSSVIYVNQMTFLNCYVDAYDGEYAVEIQHNIGSSSSYYQGIKFMSSVFRMNKNTSVSAVYADTSSARFMFLGETTSKDFDGTDVPLVSGNAKYYYLQESFSSLSIKGTGTVKFPENPTVNSFSAGQMYWDSGSNHLKATDGSRANVIPYQAESQSNSTASDIATLKSDFNSLLQKLRDSKVIK